MTHKFDIDIAEKVGVNGAILYDNIVWWCMKNEASENNFYDDRYWTYNSVKSWAKLFPYLGKKQIENALKKLEDVGLIVTGNYNKSSYDRTKWFSPNVEIDLPKRGNGNIEKGNTIPSNKPDNKQSNYELFIKELKERSSIPSKVTSTKKGQEFFKQIENVDKLKTDYVAYQLDKKEFAKRITDYMEDYQDMPQPTQHYSERLGYIV